MFLYLIILGCGNPSHVESSLSKPLKLKQNEESSVHIEKDIGQLKEVTSSLQKDMSEMNKKVANLEQMIQNHIKNEEPKE